MVASVTKQENQPKAPSANMVALQHKSLPHKASFLPLTVGQKSLFSPLAPLLPLFLLSSSIHLSPPLLLISSSSPLLHSPLPPPLLLSPLIFPSSSFSSPQGQLVCVELTTRQLLHCLLSLSSCPLHNNTQLGLANHRPGPQQYKTPTWPIGEEVLGQGGPSGLMEGTRRVNYSGATVAH